MSVHNGPFTANDGTTCANSATRDELNRRIDKRAGLANVPDAPITDNADAGRATRAELAISVAYSDADPGTNLRDLLTDLRHWADVFGVDFDVADELAEGHYYNETI